MSFLERVLIAHSFRRTFRWSCYSLILTPTDECILGTSNNTVVFKYMPIGAYWCPMDETALPITTYRYSTSPIDYTITIDRYASLARQRSQSKPETLLTPGHRCRHKVYSGACSWAVYASTRTAVETAVLRGRQGEVSKRKLNLMKRWHGHLFSLSMGPPHSMRHARRCVLHSWLEKHALRVGSVELPCSICGCSSEMWILRSRVRIMVPKFEYCTWRLYSYRISDFCSRYDSPICSVLLCYCQNSGKEWALDRIMFSITALPILASMWKWSACNELHCIIEFGNVLRSSICALYSQALLNSSHCIVLSGRRRGRRASYNVRTALTTVFVKIEREESLHIVKIPIRRTLRVCQDLCHYGMPRNAN